MRYAHSITSLVLLTLAFGSPVSVLAQYLVTTDTTQNGGTLVVNPAAALIVSDPTNNPLLTLTGGANSSGVQGTAVGNQGGEKGQLLVKEGSTLNNAGFAFIGANANSLGITTVTGTSSNWQNTGEMYLGGFGTGNLNIENGGLVTNTFSYLGYGTGSDGTATIKGVNSKWQNSLELYVGGSGKGTLNIENGGSVTSKTGNLGYKPGSTGTAIVTGIGSEWKTTNDLIIGNEGGGTLSIENGGSVTSQSGYLGYDNGTTGNATVTVKGVGSKWQSTSIIVIGGGTYSGTGNGTLNIEDGGVVLSARGSISQNYNSTGTVNVIGTGSQWQNTFQLYIGEDQGTGRLNIKDGGLVTSSDGYVGKSIGSGTANVSGTGSHWLNSGMLFVGWGGGGAGTLRIENGGLVTNTTGYVGRFTATSSINSATVTGADSHWQNSGSLNIGYGGIGTLNIEDGGLVTNGNGYVGVMPSENTSTGINAKGTATITGAGTQWQNSGSLNVGYNSTGILNIENGGLVTSNVAYLGRGDGNLHNTGIYPLGDGTATVSGAGSQWLNSGSMNVGYSNTWRYRSVGTLTIENGGLVTSSVGNVGTDYATGTVNVKGVGSKWLNSGELVIGDGGYEGFGKGTLNIENGGLVTSTNSHVGYNDGTGTANITGADSKWENSGDLLVGVNADGTLIVQDGGVVEVGGVLTVGTRGTLGGNGGTILGDVVNQGTIAPGNSPGILTIDGDLTTTGIMQFELAGIGSGLFDQLIVTGELNLGGVIEIDLIDGFNPTAGNSFKLLGFGGFIDSGYTINFTHATLGANLAWDTSTFESNGTIRVVPEASSLLLAGMATFAGLFVWRKNGR